MRTITAADANRHFSKLLRDVKAGETVIVTSHGEPVAKIEPASTMNAESEKSKRDAAWKALFERLDAQPAMNLGRVTRDEIYDDD